MARRLFGIEQLSFMLNDLAENPEKRLKLAARAMEDVRVRHALAPWVQAVSRLVLDV